MEKLEKLQQVVQIGRPITFLIVAIPGVSGCLRNIRRMMPARTS
jgi:hypothetical protein